MSRTFTITTILLWIGTILAATSSQAQSSYGTAGTAAPRSPVADGPGSAIAAPPSAAAEGHGYHTAPPLPPQAYPSGPISPLPSLPVMPYAPSQWPGGHWYQGEHDHRNGWWWIVGSNWVWYAMPVYPYPDPYVPPAVPAPAPPIRYWYWCDRPAGYYPSVSRCEQAWRPIADSPPPPPR